MDMGIPLSKDVAGDAAAAAGVTAGAAADALGCADADTAGFVIGVELTEVASTDDISQDLPRSQVFSFRAIYLKMWDLWTAVTGWWERRACELQDDDYNTRLHLEEPWRDLS